MRGGASVCMERGISARRRYAALRVARTGALDERGHGGGDHPVPFRTRQLSPPSPDVLRGKPVGGRAAALAQRARARAPRRTEGPAMRGAFLVSRPARSGISKAPHPHDKGNVYGEIGGCLDGSLRIGASFPRSLHCQCKIQ